MDFLLAGKWQINLSLKNVANIVDINNSYTFLLPKEIDLKTTLGFNYFTNEYSKNRFPEELSLFYDDASHDQGLFHTVKKGDILAHEVHYHNVQ